MNYEQPRQIQDGPNVGKWHWTTRNDNEIHAAGYCASWELCPVGHDIESLGRDFECDTCEGKGIVTKADPCPGHETAEDAAEHFRQYRIARAEFVSVKDADASMLMRCTMCEKHTASYMHIPGEIHLESVCDDHHGRDALAHLIPLTMGFAHS
jgi:hypothetical protein